MQIRGPGQVSNETEPSGQAHPDTVQTGSGVTSLSQLGAQQRRVVVEPLQSPQKPPEPGQSFEETYSGGQAQPESVHVGSPGCSPMQLP
jgi:hypothetical protein